MSSFKPIIYSSVAVLALSGSLATAQEQKAQPEGEQAQQQQGQQEQAQKQQGEKQ